MQVFDFGRSGDGRLFLVMELLEGETLADYLAREGRLAIPVITDVLAQVGEALMEAHAMGYVHRDLRPRNLLLTTRRGRPRFVKLLDFGLAKLVTPEGDGPVYGPGWDRTRPRQSAVFPTLKIIPSSASTNGPSNAFLVA